MMNTNRITIYPKVDKYIIDPKNPFKPKEKSEGKTYTCHVRVVNDYENKLPTGLKTGKTLKVYLMSSLPKYDYAMVNGTKYVEVGRSYGFGRDITITLERVGGVTDEV